MEIIFILMYKLTDGIDAAVLTGMKFSNTAALLVSDPDYLRLAEKYREEQMGGSERMKMKHTVYGYGIRLALAALLLAVHCLPVAAANVAADRATIPQDTVWSENDGQKFEIFYSTFNGHQWGPKIQLTNNQYDNMHPSMAVDANGVTWLVWTALNGMHNKIFYALRKNGHWSFPQEIETGLKSSIAPIIALAGDGTPWITWAGYNGKNDDVYVGRWDGQDWTKPQRVNPANDTPDILPEISFQGNEPEVVWQGYDGDQYQWYSSRWTGTAWTPPAMLTKEEQDVLDKKHSDDEQARKNLPEFMHAVGRAAIHYR